MPLQMQQFSDRRSDNYDDSTGSLDDEEQFIQRNGSPDEDPSQSQFQEFLVDEITPEVINEHFEMMVDEAEKKFKFDPNLWVGVPLLNTIILTGRLGRDPEFRTSQGGVNVCNFSLAVSRDKPLSCDLDPENLVDWFSVRAFGKLAETVHKVAKKGLRVGITGRVDVNAWTGRDGVTRENVVVTANSFEVLQSKSEPSFSPGMPNEFRTRRSTRNSSMSDTQSIDSYITDDDEPLGDLPF